MAQKLFLCEGALGNDLLASEPLASAVAGGLEVTAVSGFTTVDNKKMAFVLLSEPAETTDNEGGGGNTDNEGGGGNTDNDNTEETGT